MTYERPPEEPPASLDPEPRPVESMFFWATLSRFDDLGARRTIRSPNLTSVQATRDWITEHQADEDVVYAARTLVRSTGSYDEPFDVGAAPDWSRVEGLVDETRALLTGGTGRPRADRPGDHVASTEVTETVDERRRVVSLIESTRRQRAGESHVSGEAVPILTYDEVYDKDGRVRPAYAAEVEAMLAATKNIGRWKGNDE